MAFKVVILCAFALLVQSIAGQTCDSCYSNCYNPIVLPSSSYSSCYTPIVLPSSSYSSCYTPIAIPSSGQIYSGSLQSISVPSNGGSFPVTCFGPISPTGIAVSSDLSLGGDLNVNGQLPWLSAVQFSGNYATTGSGCVDYSCGSCNNVVITGVQGNPCCCCVM